MTILNLNLLPSSPKHGQWMKVHTQTVLQSCVLHHQVQMCSILWITNERHIMLYNAATMSQWTVSSVTPPQIKCFFQWTQWVGIFVRGSELVHLHFTLTSERLMGRDPGKITLQIQLEFFKSLADTRTAGLAGISQGKGPASETELELSRQTNQAHIKTSEIIWNHVALIYQLRSNTESQA